MTPEEFQRKMDFIVQAHADFMIKLDRTKEESRAEDKRLNQQMARLRTRMANTQAQIDGLVSASHDLVEVSRRLLRITEAHSNRLDRLEGTGNA